MKETSKQIDYEFFHDQEIELIEVEKLINDLQNKILNISSISKDEVKDI